MHAPVAVTECYGIHPEDTVEKKTHHVIAWLWNRSIDPFERLEAHLISNALLENSACPLLKALETTDLASSPSALCGLDDSGYEMVFMCGLEGSEYEHADAVEKLVNDTLQQVVDDGVDQETLEAMLHQLELSQREIGGDGLPYGLQLMMVSLTAAMHRGDPLEALDLDSALNALREKIKDPDYIRGRIKTLLLDNPHRVRLTLKPDTKLLAHQEADIKRQLEEKKARLSEQKKQQIVQQAAELNQRQTQENDPGLLPKVGIEDVPESIHFVEPDKIGEMNQVPLTRFHQGTNGIGYQHLAVCCNDVPEALWPYIDGFVDSLVELGCGEWDYLTAQQMQTRYTGGLRTALMVRSLPDSADTARSFFLLSGKALNRNLDKMSELLHQTWQSPRFDELNRLRELVQQDWAHQEQGLADHAHRMAMLAASAQISPIAAWKHNLFGLAGMQNLKQRVSDLQTEAHLKAYAQGLQDLHQQLLQAPKQLMLAGEPQAIETLSANLAGQWHDLTSTAQSREMQWQQPVEGIDQAWLTNVQVNFCAKAFPTVAETHADAPALHVLGAYLRNSYLHTAIREQGGAYGSGASQDHQSGTFRFFSYRDPQLEETLAAFDDSVKWLLQKPQSESKLEEALLNVISDIDKPGSPQGEAQTTFMANLFGRDTAQRQDYRRRVLAVTMADLRRVAETYLIPERAKTAVVTNESLAPQAEQLQLSLLRL